MLEGCSGAFSQPASFEPVTIFWAESHEPSASQDVVERGNISVSVGTTAAVCTPLHAGHQRVRLCTFVDLLCCAIKNNFWGREF